MDIPEKPVEFRFLAMSSRWNGLSHHEKDDSQMIEGAATPRRPDPATSSATHEKQHFSPLVSHVNDSKST